MANKRHKPEEIVTKLRQVDVLVGQGMARVDAIREVSIMEQTYYRWRKHYGGDGDGSAQGVEEAPTRERTAQEGCCRSDHRQTDPD